MTMARQAVGQADRQTDRQADSCSWITWWSTWHAPTPTLLSHTNTHTPEVDTKSAARCSV